MIFIHFFNLIFFLIFNQVYIQHKCNFMHHLHMNSQLLSTNSKWSQWKCVNAFLEICFSISHKNCSGHKDIKTIVQRNWSENAFLWGKKSKFSMLEDLYFWSLNKMFYRVIKALRDLYTNQKLLIVFNNQSNPSVEEWFYKLTNQIPYLKLVQ